MKRLPFVRSIRFRLTVLYSTLLFALAGAALAITYVAVAQTTQPQPITELTADLDHQTPLPVAGPPPARSEAQLPVDAGRTRVVDVDVEPRLGFARRGHPPQ